MKRLFCIASALLSGCGDNVEPVTPDAGMPDASMIDAPPDSSTPFTPPTPFAINLSATGPDQLQSAWPGPNGTFYAAGFAAATPTGDKFLVVTRRTATGAADTTFGTNGVVTTTVVARGANSEIHVVTQSDGKIVVATTTPAAVANVMDALDNDIALVRLATNGDLDTTFGVGGIRVVSLNESYLEPGATPTVRGRDGVRRIAIGPNDQIYVQAYQRGEGMIAGGVTPRVDTEFVVARFTANGALDLTYGGGDGKFVYDIFIAATNTHTNATPHVMVPLADGSAIAGGYANTPATGNTTQAVLYKVNAAGTALDTAWGDQGLFHEVVLATQTEIYNVARHGDNLVTAGYGRNTGTTNDWVSMRFNVNTGVRDTTWGGATNGAVFFDPSGTMLGSNCRNAIALPDGKTALVGSTGPGNMAVQDAVFAILDATGKLDTTFGTGIAKYMLGGNGNDQFWGGAVSGNNLLIVGYQGGGANPATMNDDAYGVLLTLP